MPSQCPSTLSLGSILDDRYRLETVIGEGGFGRVYAAHDLELDRPVAIKVAHADQYDRVAREARSAAGLQSPHTVRIYDLGRLGSGTPYLIMERLEGRSLKQILEIEKQIPSRIALVWMQQACDALAEAHGAGLVHRDIKPSNLFLHEPRGTAATGGLKLLDFGLAKPYSELTEELTERGILVGSPAYMSPEQVRGGRVDPRTDVWSLGVVLYELLSGERPFRGPTNAATLASIAADPLPQLQRAVPELPNAIVQVVERCLRKAVGERWQNTTELKRQLFRALSECTTGTPSPNEEPDPEDDTAEVAFVNATATPLLGRVAGLRLLGLAALGAVAVGMALSVDRALPVPESRHPGSKPPEASPSATASATPGVPGRNSTSYAPPEHPPQTTQQKAGLSAASTTPPQRPRPLPAVKRPPMQGPQQTAVPLVSSVSAPADAAPTRMAIPIAHTAPPEIIQDPDF